MVGESLEGSYQTHAIFSLAYQGKSCILRRANKPITTYYVLISIWLRPRLASAWPPLRQPYGSLPL